MFYKTEIILKTSLLLDIEIIGICHVDKYRSILNTNYFSERIHPLSRLTSIARFLQVGLTLSPLDPTSPRLDSILTLQFRELQEGWFLLDTFFFGHSF